MWAVIRAVSFQGADGLCFPFSYDVAPYIRYATVMDLWAIVSGIVHALIGTACHPHARIARHG